MTYSQCSPSSPQSFHNNGCCLETEWLNGHKVCKVTVTLSVLFSIVLKLHDNRALRWHKTMRVSCHDGGDVCKEGNCDPALVRSDWWAVCARKYKGNIQVVWLCSDHALIIVFTSISPEMTKKGWKTLMDTEKHLLPVQPFYSVYKVNAHFSTLDERRKPAWLISSIPSSSM